MVGKDPHRIQGKRGAEGWARRASERESERQLRDSPTDDVEKRPSEWADLGDLDAHPERREAPREVGGSRPGLPSRVKGAIGEVQSRDD